MIIMSQRETLLCDNGNVEEGQREFLLFGIGNMVASQWEHESKPMGTWKQANGNMVVSQRESLLCDGSL